ncbi:MAG TPA: hypothetical protein VJZ00_06585 [Thermoanaerobaculia bacterium]|nr:hypothetical protein [Thermoanaerobaculia bacterium]
MIYRKRGVSTRWENGTRIDVTECGVAIEEGDFFECYPDPAAARDAAASAGEDAGVPLLDARIERYIVTRGVAEHEYGDKRWREEMERVHVSLVKDQTRVLIDHFDDVATAANALTRLEREREAPQRLVLARNVTAALVPSLIALAPPNVKAIQTAGGIDGKGQAIEDGATAWYRPSYRVRPIRIPMNVRLECTVTQIEPGLPRAVALCAPVQGLTLRVLIDDGLRAYPATVRVTRIDAVSTERTWYPYGGGSFGAEMML